MKNKFTFNFYPLSYISYLELLKIRLTFFWCYKYLLKAYHHSKKMKWLLLLGVGTQTRDFITKIWLYKLGVFWTRETWSNRQLLICLEEWLKFPQTSGVAVWLNRLTLDLARELASYGYWFMSWLLCFPTSSLLVA